MHVHGPTKTIYYYCFYSTCTQLTYHLKSSRAVTRKWNVLAHGSQELPRLLFLPLTVWNNSCPTHGFGGDERHPCPASWGEGVTPQGKQRASEQSWRGGWRLEAPLARWPNSKASAPSLLWQWSFKSAHLVLIKVAYNSEALGHVVFIHSHHFNSVLLDCGWRKAQLVIKTNKILLRRYTERETAERILKSGFGASESDGLNYESTPPSEHPRGTGSAHSGLLRAGPVGSRLEPCPDADHPPGPSLLGNTVPCGDSTGTMNSIGLYLKFIESSKNQKVRKESCRPMSRRRYCVHWHKALQPLRTTEIANVWLATHKGV